MSTMNDEPPKAIDQNDIMAILQKDYLKITDNNELLKRLRKANVVLMEIDQLDETEEQARGSMKYIKGDLVSSNLLKNANKDVRLLAACCLINILRILAPQSGQVKDELKAIFTLFASQIQRLCKNDTDDVDKIEQVIKSMADLNICMELVNVDAHDTLGVVINTIFQTCANYPKADKYLDSFKTIATDVYKDLHEPNEELVYNLIVNVVNKKVSPNSQDLAKTVIESNIDTLTVPVDNFVHSILTVRTDPTDELSEETYTLVYELYLIHPDLVMKTIALLSDEMTSQVTDRRAKACMLVGKIGSKQGNIILTDFPQILTEYFASVSDENTEVRKAVADSAPKLFRNAQADSELLDNVNAKLVELNKDGESSVRLAQVSRLSDKLIKQDLLNKVNQLLFDEQVGRAMDKDKHVRHTVLTSLTKVQSKYTVKLFNTMMQHNAPHTLNKIPGKLINSLTQSTDRDQILTEQLIDQNILKIEFNSDESHPTNAPIDQQSFKKTVDKLIYQRTQNLVGLLFKACERKNKQFDRIENFFENKQEHMNLFKNQIDLKKNGNKSDTNQYNDAYRTLTTIYNFDNISVLTIIEELNMEDRHDLDLIYKLSTLTTVFDQSQANLMKVQHDTLNECVYMIQTKMNSRSKNADKSEVYNLLLRLTNHYFQKENVQVLLEMYKSMEAELNHKLKSFILQMMNLASKQAPKAFTIIQDDLVAEINTTNDSDKTYILKLISTLGINLRTVNLKPKTNPEHIEDIKNTFAPDQSEIPKPTDLTTPNPAENMNDNATEQAQDDKNEKMTQQDPELNQTEQPKEKEAKDQDKDMTDLTNDPTDLTKDTSDPTNPTKPTSDQVKQKEELYKNLEQSLRKLVMEGKPLQSKQALRILHNNSLDKSQFVKQLADEVCSKFTLENQQLTNKIQSVSMLFDLNTASLSKYKNGIVSQVMDECIISSSNQQLQYNSSQPQTRDWCLLNSQNDDKLLLKLASVKLLYKFVKNLTQDPERKQIMQADIVFKVFLDCISSYDKQFSDKENFIIRKQLISKTIKLLSFEKFNKHIQAYQIGFIALLLSDKDSNIRDATADKLIKYLQGYQKQQNQFLTLNPAFIVTLLYYEVQNAKPRFNIKQVFTKYIQSVRAKLSAKNEFIIELFSQNLYYTFFRIPNLVLDKNTEIIRTVFNKFVEQVSLERDKFKIERLVIIRRVLDELKYYYVKTAEHEECLFETTRDYRKLVIPQEQETQRNLKNVFKEVPVSLQELNIDLIDQLKDQLQRNYIRNANANPDFIVNENSINTLLFYKVSKEVKKNDRELLKGRPRLHTEEKAAYEQDRHHTHHQSSKPTPTPDTSKNNNNFSRQQPTSSRANPSSNSRDNRREEPQSSSRRTESSKPNPKELGKIGSVPETRSSIRQKEEIKKREQQQQKLKEEQHAKEKLKRKRDTKEEQSKQNEENDMFLSAANNEFVEQEFNDNFLMGAEDEDNHNEQPTSFFGNENEDVSEQSNEKTSKDNNHQDKSINNNNNLNNLKIDDKSTKNKVSELDELYKEKSEKKEDPKKAKPNSTTTKTGKNDKVEVVSNNAVQGLRSRTKKTPEPEVKEVIKISGGKGKGRKSNTVTSTPKGKNNDENEEIAFD